MKKLLVIGVIALSAVACKKIEGEGGRSSISGNVVIKEKLYMNGVCVDTVTYAGAGEDIYIVYGTEDEVYDDKMECSYDGSFKFDYLNAGEYTIFGYSEIFHTGPNVPNNDDDYKTSEAVKQTVTLEKKQSQDAGTITLWK